MSLFDSLASSFGQPSSDDGKSPGGLMGAAMEFVNNQPGGLNGLIQKFHDQGAGEIVQSWIGNGENKDISPSLLSNVLGSDMIGQLAEKAGMQPEQLTGLLAMVLPNLVDQATPDGTVPADGKLDASGIMGALGGLAGLFGKA